MPEAIYQTPPTPQDIYDITGQTYGKFFVVGLERIVRKRRFWRIRCTACGTEQIQPAYFRTRGCVCPECHRQEIKSTPDWLIALGFDETFWDRFWSRVNKDGTVPSHVPHLGPCWLWTAGVNGGGYGSISRYINTARGRAELILTHRASWIINSKDQVPDGMSVLHKCDNRRCVRPDHLFLGTYLDNSNDMIAKGRAVHARGSEHPNAVLTEELVKEIRHLRERLFYTYEEIAEMVKISYSSVAMICRYESWRHVGGDAVGLVDSQSHS